MLMWISANSLESKNPAKPCNVAACGRKKNVTANVRMRVTGEMKTHPTAKFEHPATTIVGVNVGERYHGPCVLLTAAFPRERFSVQTIWPAHSAKSNSRKKHLYFGLFSFRPKQSLPQHHLCVPYYVVSTKTTYALGVITTSKMYTRRVCCSLSAPTLRPAITSSRT